jgi:two-component SAPR family response regulator
MNGMDLSKSKWTIKGKMVKNVITGFLEMANMSSHPDTYLLKPVEPQEPLTLISQKTM